MDIWIVESDQYVGSIIQRGLRLSGNEVTWYKNAPECLNALLEQSFNKGVIPDILLIDLGQDKSGREMIKQLRLFFAPPDLPIFIMSGRDLLELNLLSEDLFDIRSLQQSLTPFALRQNVQGPWPVLVN